MSGSDNLIMENKITINECHVQWDIFWL